MPKTKPHPVLNIHAVEVFLADQKVERMALTPRGLCAFEYDANYLQKGNSISPFHLPLENNEYALDFTKLAAEAEKILTTQYSGKGLDALYQYAGSSGGARPKVFVTVKGEEWLIKFKAANDDNQRQRRPFNRRYERSGPSCRHEQERDETNYRRGAGRGREEIGI